MSRGWIIVYGVKRGGRGAAIRRASRIKYFLVKKQGVAPARVLTLAGPNLDEPLVELWISTVGQSLPELSRFIPKSVNKGIDNQWASFHPTSKRRDERGRKRVFAGGIRFQIQLPGS